MKITIPKPCDEKWESMTPQEKGRFCAVCSKTVRDFTNDSDDEILDYFLILHLKIPAETFTNRSLIEICIIQ